MLRRASIVVCFQGSLCPRRLSGAFLQQSHPYYRCPHPSRNDRQRGARNGKFAYVNNRFDTLTIVPIRRVARGPRCRWSVDRNSFRSPRGECDSGSVQPRPPGSTSVRTAINSQSPWNAQNRPCTSPALFLPHSDLHPRPTAPFPALQHARRLRRRRAGHQPSHRTDCSPRNSDSESRSPARPPQGVACTG